MIVDAHHHLWDPALREYSWMDETVASIARRFDLAEMDEGIPPEVAATIVVQAASSLEESVSLLALAASSQRIKGVVGWIDLTADAGQQLLQLRKSRGGEFLVGIRHQVQDESDPRWLVRDEVVAGLTAVHEAGLLYELLVRTRELDAAYEVATRLPHMCFVLDHAAKPPIAEGAFEPWAAKVSRLASLSNVTCKLSGLITEARWYAWSDDEVLPYARHVLQVFGPSRVMFGSDWPVCLLSGSYADVKRVAERTCEDLDEAERESVFSGNALGVYRLRAHHP